MADTSFKGTPAHTVGELPKVGTPAPSFTLTKTDLTDLTNGELTGQRIVLNIFPSLDTAVCAASVRRFNELAAGFDNTTVVCVSADLPFAQKRFCAAEGLDRVVPASTFRSDFGTAYGVQLADSKMASLMGRAVVILDEHGTVIYSHLSPEITEEPNYDGAVAALG